VVPAVYDAALRTAGSEILAAVEDARADWQHRRDQLVDGLLQAGHVSSERVAAAFRVVPRHVFVPGIEPERAYRDEAFPIKYDRGGRPVSSSSQPAIMARMLDQLDVQPGHRVLEIGTGSGYNAALLAHVVGETGAVVSVDIDADIAADARERLAACGVSQVTVGCGDGGLGWSEHAPYDRIIATVGAWDISPAWWLSSPHRVGWSFHSTCEARSARSPSNRSMTIWKASRWSTVHSCVSEARSPVPNQSTSSAPNPGCSLEWPNSAPWTPTRFMRRWPSLARTSPAVCASRVATPGPGSASGWRCTNPP
jgi:protein-L-isoaspartate(D-aspartate) O-methyltransferase